MKLKLGALAVLAGLVVTAATLLPARDASAAVQQLSLSQVCDNGQLQVTFMWQNGAPGPVQEWLDLSLSDNGWQPGTFLGAGPVALQFQESVTWPGLIQNTLHYVRVNQQLADGTWDPSAAFYFTTGMCGSGSTPTSPKLPGLPADRERVLAPIQSLQLVSSDHYAINAKVGLPGGCAQQGGFEVSESGTDIKVNIYDTLPIANTICNDIFGIYDTTVDLPTDLVPGQTYTIDVNGTVITLTP